MKGLIQSKGGTAILLQYYLGYYGLRLQGKQVAMMNDHVTVKQRFKD